MTQKSTKYKIYYKWESISPHQITECHLRTAALKNSGRNFGLVSIKMMA